MRQLLVLSLFVATGLAEASDTATLDLERQLQSEIVRASAEGRPPSAKEFTPGCVATPFPTTPAGPQVSAIINTGSTSQPERATLVLWRVRCSPQDAQTLITFIPTIGAPFICSASATVVQGGQQLGVFFSRSGTSIDSICGDVIVPITGYLRPSTTGAPFNDDAAFTLFYDDATSALVRADVPAYDPSAYDGGVVQASIKRQYAGSWNSPGIENQGWLIDVDEAARLFVVAWFTGTSDGARLDWYTALGNYSGDTATMTVYRTTGVRFGQPTTVNTAAFGTLTMRFTSCTAGTATYSLSDNRQGTLPMQRITPVQPGC